MEPVGGKGINVQVAMMNLDNEYDENVDTEYRYYYADHVVLVLGNGPLVYPDWVTDDLLYPNGGVV